MWVHYRLSFRTSGTDMTEKTINAQNDGRAFHHEKRSSNPLKRLSGVALAALCAVTMLYPYGAHALGTRIPNQDAESTAKGNAVIATADNPSALYYNPAGITQIQGPEAQFGLHVISVNSHFEAEAGGSSDTKFEIQIGRASCRERRKKW